MINISKTAEQAMLKIEDVRGKILSGDRTNGEIFTDLTAVKEALSTIKTNGQPDNNILCGYKGDCMQSMQQLDDTIRNFGHGLLDIDIDQLQIAMLSAENFAEKARRVIKLHEELTKPVDDGVYVHKAWHVGDAQPTIIGADYDSEHTARV